MSADIEDTAVAVRLGNGRFFVGFGAAGRLKTAWCLAGSTLFGDWDTSAIERVQNRLREKGHDSVTVRVQTAEIDEVEAARHVMASCMDALAEMALGTETENQLVHVMDEALGRVIRIAGVEYAALAG